MEINIAGDIFSCLLTVRARQDRSRFIYFFHFFYSWSIREGGLFNQPFGCQPAFKRKRTFPLKMNKTSLFSNSFSLQIYSLLIYGRNISLKKKKVYLQAITLSLAIRDRSIQEGGLFHKFIFEQSDLGPISSYGFFIKLGQNTN